MFGDRSVRPRLRLPAVPGALARLRPGGHSPPSTPAAESLELFRAMADSAPVLMWMSDEDGNPSFFNKGWIDFTGRGMDQELQTSWVGVHPEDMESARRIYAAAIAAREGYEMEYRLQRADGVFRRVIDRAVPRYLPDGAFAGLVGVVVDISERWEAERATTEMAAFPRLNPNPVLAFGPNGGLTYANDAAQRIAESLGRDSIRAILPSDLLGVLGRVLAEERRELRFETRISGRVLRWHFFAVDDAKAIHCYLTDITERKEAEEALRDREERFRTLVGNIPGAVYRCAADEHWTMTFMSPAIEELSGYPASDFLENAVRTYESVIHPDDRGLVVLAVDAALCEGSPFVVEYRIVRADGAVRWVYEKGQGVRSPAGEILWLDGAIFDVTERKHADQLLAAQNEELRALDRMKDEFLALVSHELRTPLTSIIGYLELLIEEEDLSEEQRRFLDIVERNAHRLLRLVGDLLFVAQIEAGKLRLDFIDTDLGRLAAECVEAHRPRAESHGVTLTLDVEDVPRFQGDPARLGQLLDNLVSNAVKFTLPGGEVRVRVTSGDRVAALEVSDSGIGIPREEQERLFDRFFRASTAAKHEIQGTGLGLTITRAIVEGHAGRISLTSEEGAGTTFRVELPLPFAAEKAA